MANTSSAEKRQRQAEKRNIRNRAGKSALRTQLKKAREVIAGGDSKEMASVLDAAYSSIDVAARKGFIHENTANRYKSRLAASVKRASA